MHFTCTEQCELPFMLNLSDGVYQVLIANAAYELTILQNQVAVHLANKRFAIGNPERLRCELNADYDHAHKQLLRTVVRHVTTTDVAREEIPQVSDADLVSDMKSDIISETPTAFAGRTDDLGKEATRRVAEMSKDAKDSYRWRSAKLRFARQLPSTDLFLSALNSLIRLYMQRFNDFFAEEVTLLQLASQSPLLGVFVDIECEGEHLLSYSHVDKMPPIMRQPWQLHPDPRIEEFKNDLKAGVAPDSVLLLEVRARAFLERGATRSAVIEASAALELALTRKLRQGFANKGKIATEIDAILRKEIRFKDRANRLLINATGKGLANLNNKLYATVLANREKHRHGIAHADTEPSQPDAEQVIRDFEQLRIVVDGIPV